MEHSQIREIMQWPLYAWRDDECPGAVVECDYCGAELWDYLTSDDARDRVTLDILYKAISQHRLNGCPNVPASEAS
jgi:hypothetical protein